MIAPCHHYPKRFAVVAGSFEQFQHYMSKEAPDEVSLVNTVYVSTIERLCGWEPEKVIFTGTWSEHPDIEDIQRRINTLRNRGVLK